MIDKKSYSVSAGIALSDVSLVGASLISAMSAVWGLRKMIDLVLKPSLNELFKYSYTLKSKRKYKKVKGYKFSLRPFKKKYILSDSRLSEITKYNQKTKERRIV